MEIYYLHNSAFAVLIENTTIIFDYYNDKPVGDSRKLENGVVCDDALLLNQHTYVLSSHSHYDHFSKGVLDWKTINSSISYILDSGIMEKDQMEYPEIAFMNEGDIFDDGHIWIKAYGSTDIGISFLVRVEGYTMFHAGDLNFWHWENEADADFIASEEQKFLNKLEPIIADDYNINIMFFPVDYRMGDNGHAGAVKMIEIFEPQMFIPMHFHEEYRRIKTFKENFETKHTKIWHINKRGDALHLI